MFTGLVEEKGKLVNKIKTGDGLRLVINAKVVFQDLQIGSSVAVNGVCLTVVELNNEEFVEALKQAMMKKYPELDNTEFLLNVINSGYGNVTHTTHRAVVYYIPTIAEVKA